MEQRVRGLKQGEASSRFFASINLGDIKGLQSRRDGY